MAAQSSEILEITRSDLSSLDAPEDAFITGVKHLASYNWIEATTPTPTIAVPGCPPLWNGATTRRRVPQDSGWIWISQNAARLPENPLEPLFRALQVEQPSFDLDSIDLVTDRNNLRKLLNFVNPTFNTYKSDPFKISAELVGKTAIFDRIDTKVQEFIKPQDFRGFHHEFEKSNTSVSIPNSTGHHRIITYRLGSLSLLVRHDADCYVADDKTGQSDKADMEAVDITHTLEALAYGTRSGGHKSRLVVVKQGHTVPPESIINIKTRSKFKDLPIEEVAPPLWLSQTTKLVRGRHEGGMFDVPKVEGVTNIIGDWEMAHQDNLRTLVALLNEIISILKVHHRIIVQYETGDDRLIIKIT